MARLHLADGIDGALMVASGGTDADGPFDVNRFLSPIAVAAAPPYLLVISPTLPMASAILNSISIRDSLLGVALAQQVLRQIGERGPRQCGERQRSGDIDRREPEPRRQ
jgi:hypothetical protein